MTRSEEILSLKQQRQKLLDKKILLEAKANNYIKRYDQLSDKYVEQQTQLDQLQKFSDFCESVPEKILGNVINEGCIGFGASLGAVLVTGGVPFIPFIVGPIVGVIGSMIKTPMTYYSLKKKAMLGDLLDFEMKHYDVSERKKGTFGAREIMRHEAEEYGDEGFAMDSQINSLVKGKIR